MIQPEEYDPSEEYQHEDNIGVYESNPLTVKPEHIKLLERMNVGWNDGSFGAPEISAKRPYGNSDVVRDIREITEMPGADRDWCIRLHKEMEAVLQVFLKNSDELSPGEEIIYKDYKWQKAAEGGKQ